MSFNSIGLYQPFEQEGCLDKCTLCIDVCPFVKSNKSEKEIAQQLYQNENNVNHHNDLGYFVQTYEIYKKDTDDRLQSASGGAGHALLKALLESQKVDAVLSVEPNDDPEKLFKFSVFSSSLELEKTKGSVYYPTELSEVLEYVMKNEGNYAVTILPCYATAIRLAQEKNHKLRKRIKYLVGLVCGQMKTKAFTHALAKNALGTDRLKSVKYRVNKKMNQPVTLLLSSKV
jgi:coenzyme F420-reducing hydrogenase beta subunit